MAVQPVLLRIRLLVSFEMAVQPVLLYGFVYSTRYFIHFLMRRWLSSLSCCMDSFTLLVVSFIFWWGDGCPACLVVWIRLLNSLVHSFSDEEMAVQPVLLHGFIYSLVRWLSSLSCCTDSFTRWWDGCPACPVVADIVMCRCFFTW